MNRSSGRGVQGTKIRRFKIRVVRVPEEKRERETEAEKIYLKNRYPQTFPIGNSVEPEEGLRVCHSDKLLANTEEPHLTCAGSGPALSRRAPCNGKNVLYPHCPVCQPRAARGYGKPARWLVSLQNLLVVLVNVNLNLKSHVWLVAAVLNGAGLEDSVGWYL